MMSSLKKLAEEEKLQLDLKEVYYQGKHLNKGMYISQEQFESVIRQLYYDTIWISYRKKFAKLKCTFLSTTTDEGWGCMIRCGQNIFAEILACHFGASFQVSQQVIDLFRDSPERPFSIQNISEIALQMFKIKPGSWYAPNHILYSLQALYQAHPLREQTKLEFLVKQSDNLISFQDILQVFCGNEAKIGNEVDQHGFRQIYDPSIHKSEKSICLFITCLLGLKKPEQHLILQAIELFKLPSCLGAIGGKGKNALYFTGIINDKYLIYLDPHLTQDTCLQKEYDSYFCKNFKMIEINQMSSTLAFGFYLKNLESFQQFYQNLKQIQNKYQNSFFIYFEESNNQITTSTNQSGWIVIDSETQKEDEFEIIQ